MRNIFFVLFVMLSSQAYAMKSASGCKELKALQEKLIVHTSNIVNGDSTKSYKMIWDCSLGHCAAKKSKAKRIVYEPGHPDANRRGYVSYPDIDVVGEYRSFVSTTEELKTVASQGLCHSHISNLGQDGLFIKYKKSLVSSDSFNFKKNKLISWGRTFSNGRKVVYDFSSRIDHKKSATNSIAF